MLSLRVGGGKEVRESPWCLPAGFVLAVVVCVPSSYVPSSPAPSLGTL